MITPSILPLPARGILRDSQLQETDNRPRLGATAGAEVGASGCVVNRHRNNRVAAANAGDTLQSRIRIVVSTSYRDWCASGGSAAGRQQFVLAQCQTLTARVDETSRSLIREGPGSAA